MLWKFPLALPGAPTSTTTWENSTRERGNYGREMTGNFAENGDFHAIVGTFYIPQICDMWPTALLPLRRKVCWGFFRPEKIWRLRPGSNPRTWGTKGQHAYLWATEAASRILRNDAWKLFNKVPFLFVYFLVYGENLLYSPGSRNMYCFLAQLIPGSLNFPEKLQRIIPVKCCQKAELQKRHSKTRIDRSSRISLCTESLVTCKKVSAILQQNFVSVYFAPAFYTTSTVNTNNLNLSKTTCVGENYVYELESEIFRIGAAIYAAVVVARSTGPNRPNYEFRVRTWRCAATAWKRAKTLPLTLRRTALAASPW
jgi:hypothetical protein